MNYSSTLLVAREGPAPSYQVPIIAHAFCCVIAFALFLPGGALLARYLRTFKPWWYSLHWIVQLTAGVFIVIGVALGVVANHESQTALDNHKRTGVALFVLYILQCSIGAVVHFFKASDAKRRPVQNYFHGLLGVIVIAMGMYQIRTGYNVEWPAYMATDRHPTGKLPGWINTLWIVWCIMLVVAYASGMWYLRKQYGQEATERVHSGHIVLGALEGQQHPSVGTLDHSDRK
ncbi:hypothetical protein DFH06DRAFT_1484988 [Mycena polygramma]|nr:hypothetical protein DFH06DRAFT_1484988 [Mycena polygramma]